MPAFKLIGEATIGATLKEKNKNKIIAVQFAAAKTGTITAVEFNGLKPATESFCDLGVYEESAGKPGKLLGHKKTAAKIKTTEEKPKVEGLSISVVSGTKYWIAAVYEAGEYTYKFNKKAGFETIVNGGVELPKELKEEGTWTKLAETEKMGAQGLGVVVSTFVASMPTEAPPYTMLDDFNRAEENPLSNEGKWTTIAGYGAMKVTVEKVVGTEVSPAINGAYWNPQRYEAVKVASRTVAIATGNTYILFASLTEPESSTLKSGYVMYVEITSLAKAAIKTWRLKENVKENETATTEVPIAIGDRWGLEVNGGQVTSWHRGEEGRGGWAVVNEKSDTTYERGFIGIGVIGTAQADNFQVEESNRSPVKNFTFRRTFTAFVQATVALFEDIKIGPVIKVKELEKAVMEAKGSLAKAFTLPRTLTAFVATTASLAKSLLVTRLLAAKVQATGLLSKSLTIARTFTARLEPKGTLTKALSFARTLTASVTASGAMQKAFSISKTLTAALWQRELIAGNRTAIGTHESLEYLRRGRTGFSQFTITETTVVNTIKYFVIATSTAATVHAGVFTNSSGKPGTLIAEERSLSTTPAVGPEWHEITGYSFTLTPGTYWLAVAPSTTDRLNMSLREEGGTITHSEGEVEGLTTSGIVANETKGPLDFQLLSKPTFFEAIKVKAGVKVQELEKAVMTATSSLAKAFALSRTFTAFVEPRGVFSKAFTIIKALTAKIETTAGLLKVFTFARTLTGKVELAATLTKAFAVTRTLTAKVEAIATLTKAFALARTLTAKVEPTATLRKAFTFAKTLAAKVEPTATLTKAFTLTRTLTGKVEVTATIAKAFMVTRALTAKVESTALLTKAMLITKLLTAKVEATALLSKAFVVTRKLVGKVEPTATLTKAFLFARTLTASITSQASFAKVLIISKVFAAKVETTATIKKAFTITRTLLSSVAPTGIFSAIQEGIRRFTASMQATGSVTKSFVLPRLLSASVTATSAFRKAFALERRFVASLTLTGLAQKAFAIAKKLTGELVSGGTMQKAFVIRRTFVALVQPIGSLSHTSLQRLFASLSFAVSRTKTTTATAQQATLALQAQITQIVRAAQKAILGLSASINFSSIPIIRKLAAALTLVTAPGGFPSDIYFAFRKTGSLINRIRQDIIFTMNEIRKVEGTPQEFEEFQINDEEEVNYEERFVLDRDPDSTKGKI